MLNDIRIIIHTTKGDIEATLFPSKAPVTTASFLNLASRKFYDGLTFHRVVPNFVIQGGDPLGTGTGGPGYRFENEIDASLSHVNVGVLAMANSGPNTNGSQFFLVFKNTTLPASYTPFGKITSGLDILQNVAKAGTSCTIQAGGGPPKEKVIINSVTVKKS